MPEVTHHDARKILEKYRNGDQLTESDKITIEHEVETTDNTSLLQSLIYAYGTTWLGSDTVRRVARKFAIATPVPGLTATCLKVLVDYWCENGACVDALKAYLDYALFDEWADEVIFSGVYFSNISSLDEDMLKKVSDLKIAALADNNFYLLDAMNDGQFRGHNGQFRGHNT